jgi:LCP family protein required for cell wall assembly
MSDEKRPRREQKQAAYTGDTVALPRQYEDQGENPDNPDNKKTTNPSNTRSDQAGRIPTQDATASPKPAASKPAARSSQPPTDQTQRIPAQQPRQRSQADANAAPPPPRTPRQQASNLPTGARSTSSGDTQAMPRSGRSQASSASQAGQTQAIPRSGRAQSSAAAPSGSTQAMPRPSRAQAPSAAARGQVGASPRYRPAPRGISIWRWVRWAIIALVVVVLIAVVSVYMQLRSISEKVVVRDVRSNAPFSSPLVGYNLLLIGTDARRDHPEEGVRGDTLIVAHVDTSGRWVSVLSIPRDTQVNLPGIGETKINVAFGQGYAYAEQLYGEGTTPEQGGMAFAAETVSQFLGLPIHQTATLNFDGFAQIIDALGGVTIDVPKHIIDEEYPTEDFGIQRIEFLPGPQEMDGERALIYARTRHADDDFSRAARQQQVIKAIISEVQGRSIPGLLSLIPRFNQSIDGAFTTTLPIANLDTLAGSLMLASGIDANAIHQVRLSPETAPNYMEYGSNLVWDPNDVKNVVQTFLQKPSEASEAASVQVLNATEVGGLANQFSLQLEQAGFRVMSPDNANIETPARTTVYNLRDKPLTSARLAETLNAELRSGPLPDGVWSGADIVVILGTSSAR